MSEITPVLFDGESSAHSSLPPSTSRFLPPPPPGGRSPYRGGSAPETPKFDGNSRDQLAFTKYKRKVEIYVLLAKPYIPKNEMALRLVKDLNDDAAEEIEPWIEENGMEYFDCEEGVDKIIEALEPAFGERKLKKKTNLISAFESILRDDGEALSRFVDRFKRTERRLIATGVARYDDEVRAHKLLTASRISVNVRNTLLATAGHVYSFARIEDAIKVIYPTDEFDKNDRADRPKAPRQERRQERPKKPFPKKKVSQTNVAEADSDDDEATVRSASPVPEAGDAPREDEDESLDGDFESIAAALTVTAKKLKAVTLGRGWTRKPPDKGRTSSSALRADTSSRLDPAAKASREKEIQTLKKSHPARFAVSSDIGTTTRTPTASSSARWPRQAAKESISSTPSTPLETRNPMPSWFAPTWRRWCLTFPRRCPPKC